MKFKIKFNYFIAMYPIMLYFTTDWNFFANFMHEFADKIAFIYEPSYERH